MTKYFLIFIFCFYSLNLFAQNKDCNKATLLCLNISNKQLITIIDSIVTFSRKCEKEDLKSLFFKIEINETGFNFYQFIITLVDNSGLDYALRLKDTRFNPCGYFIHNEQTFIVTGRSLPEGVFQIGDGEKIFITNRPSLVYYSDYSTWVYTYNPEEGFLLLNFYPLCKCP